MRGLTTAAALWIVAAIGMAAGAGYYFGAVTATVIILVTLVGFRRLRPALWSRLRTDFVLLELEMDASAAIGDVFAALTKQGAWIEGMQSDREDDGKDLEVRIELLVPPGANLERALDEIRDMAGISSAHARGLGASRWLGAHEP